MVWYEEEVSQLQKKTQDQLAANKDTDKRRVAFYGSSSIRLWTTLAQDFPEYNTVNLGFGGSTLAACAWFFERLVVPVKPQSIIFYAGDNDLGDERHAEEVYLFFCTLHQKMQVHLPEVPLTFLSIKASPARWNIVDRIRYANELIRQEITKIPHYHYIDVQTPMLNAKGQPRRELFGSDGLHMTPAGYEIWRQILKQHPQVF